MDLKRQGIGSSYSHAELLGAYRAAEQTWLKSVFRDDYSTKLTTYDLLDHLACQADKYGLSDSEEYASLCKGLREFASQYGGLINGEKGERFARRALGWLKVPHEAVENITLAADGQAGEFDQIVITPAGVFIIEVKYSTSDTVIDADGYLRGRSWKRCKPYNVGEHIRSKEHVLWKTLEASPIGCVTRDHIHSLLLFSNSTADVVDNFGKVKVLCCGNVSYYIEEFDNRLPPLTAAQMESIRAVIEANGIEVKYRPQVDLEQIGEDFAAVMALIAAEAASSDVYADTHVNVPGEEPEEAGGLRPAKAKGSTAAIAALAAAALLGLAGAAFAAVRPR